MARFEEVRPNRGVDSARLGHEWMMVPHGGDNLVRLADGSGFAVAAVVSGGSRLEVKEALAKDWPMLLGSIGAFFARRDDRLFRVSGKQPGPAKLNASKGTLQTTLEVSVHKKLTLTVAFFFLQDRDSKGNLQPRTAFTPADADKWISSLNDVFGLQANIWFKKVRADWLPVPNLRAEVSADDAEMLAGKKDPGAKINIFLAGPRITPSDKSHQSHVNGFYHIAQKLIILKDRFVSDPWSQPAAPMLQTMAHEIGHLMNFARGAGQGHDFFKGSGYNFDILNTMDGSDIKIPHQRVLDWNPW